MTLITRGISRSRLYYVAATERTKTLLCFNYYKFRGRSKVIEIHSRKHLFVCLLNTRFANELVSRQ